MAVTGESGRSPPKRRIGAVGGATRLRGIPAGRTVMQRRGTKCPTTTSRLGTAGRGRGLPTTKAAIDWVKLETSAAQGLLASLVNLFLGSVPIGNFEKSIITVFKNY